MEPVVYVLLGALIAVLVFAILMPMRQDRPVMPRFGPYWAHGGGAYRPGVLY